MPLTVERFRNDDVLLRLNASNTINASKMQADIQGCAMPAEKSRKSLRNRPAINYSQFDYSSDEELSTDVSEHKVRPTLRKKGVIRGCPDCTNCQKVNLLDYMISVFLFFTFDLFLWQIPEMLEVAGTMEHVLARWHPEDACRPVIDEAPVFYTSEEEFKDTLKYIETVRAKAETYGAIAIIQAIEALDHNHISSEYWTSKPLNQKPPITNDGTSLQDPW